MNNLILIGMPGAGKSTVGVLLAKTIGYQFIDTDLSIQEEEKQLLQEIIDGQGQETFLRIEERVVSNLQAEKSVIATGGSVIYSEKAMKHLKAMGEVIYLQLLLHSIEERLSNITTRGVAMKEGQTLGMLYEERCPLYEKYADRIIPCEKLTAEETVAAIIKNR